MSRFTKPEVATRQRTTEGGSWQGVVRMVQTASGLRPFYWVAFGEPHRDAEGDGPYGGAEIPEDAQTRI